MYEFVTATAVQVVFAGREFCTFVNLSVTTRNALQPSDCVKSATKSIAISYKGRSPVGIATNFVSLLCLSALRL